ncbi:hypothetical protein DERF_008755, partial [Dermatophagoides farinae]
NVCFFVEKNGISRLLEISSQCFIFPGSIPMATLIIRHMIEHSLLLKTSMDMILCAQTNPPPNSIRELRLFVLSFQSRCPYIVILHLLTIRMVDHSKLMDRHASFSVRNVDGSSYGYGSSKG